ncbi:MAG: RsmE family RNA methyltransferase, partial [Alphaproteobacteria bacterium]|nr:RsmE family RNA methyltransferase [Alphaproteobacteria bacterium]
ERMVEKAVELGVSALLPVVTQHSVVRSVNEDKLLAHAIEAAEQCERHDVPQFVQYKDIGALLGNWPQDRLLLHADETGGGRNLQDLLPALAGKKYAVLIGPEGGFSADERRMIAACGQAVGFGMGPRILRADTAAIAALACVQCYAGDWDAPPRFEGTN